MAELGAHSGNQPFQPLPPPAGPYPYHLDLASVLGNDAVAAIASGRTVYSEITVSDTGTVCVVSTDAASLVAIVVSTDGGDSFHPATNPATGITTLEDGLPAVTTGAPSAAQRALAPSAR